MTKTLGYFIVLLLLFVVGALFVANVTYTLDTARKAKDDERDAMNRLSGVWLSTKAYLQYGSNKISDEEVAKALGGEGCLQIREDGQVLLGGAELGRVRNSHGIETSSKEIIAISVDHEGEITVFLPDSKKGRAPTFHKVR
jgi:hypothetical protein